MLLSVMEKKGRKDSRDNPVVMDALEAHNIAKLKAMDVAIEKSKK
jgi:hypothetical protein